MIFVSFLGLVAYKKAVVLSTHMWVFCYYYHYFSLHILAH